VTHCSFVRDFDFVFYLFVVYLFVVQFYFVSSIILFLLRKKLTYFARSKARSIHHVASEQELAEYMGEQNINNLCNSHPILSFVAAVVVVPTTKTSC